MNPVVKASVILAVAVSLFQLVVVGIGLHENPMVFGLAFIVVAIGLNIAAVLWALKQTAGANGYGKQLMNGAAIGLLGGVLIFVFAFVMMSFIFPDYLQQSRDAAVAFFEDAGMTDAQIDAQIQTLDARTPFNQALQGFFGTFGTSVIVAAIGAIFLRRK